MPVQPRARKPIGIFFSPLSERFFASAAYKVDAARGLVTITGAKDEVTDQIFGSIDQAPTDGRLVLLLTRDIKGGWANASLGRFERDPNVVPHGMPAWISDMTGDELEPTHFVHLPSSAAVR